MTRNNRKGFTLIELLIVVVIIGILAAVAIPKFANTKEKAYVSAMKSDLKNLATAQEAYSEDKKGDYGKPTLALQGELVDGTKVYWKASAGVTVSKATGDDKGWGAQLTRTGTSVKCDIWSGDLALHKTANGFTGEEGEPTCK